MMPHFITVLQTKKLILSDRSNLGDKFDET